MIERHDRVVIQLQLPQLVKASEGFGVDGADSVEAQIEESQ